MSLSWMAKSPSNPVPRKKLNDEGVLEKYRAALLKFVTQCDPPVFKNRASEFFYSQSNFRGFLKLGPHGREGEEIWKICQTSPVVEGKTFRAAVIGREDRDCSDLVVTLKGDAEWDAARSEAASMLRIDPMPPVSKEVEEAYHWLTKEENIGKTWTDDELKERFKIDPISALINKLHCFRDPRLKVTRKGYHDIEVEICAEPRPELSLKPLNPVFPPIPKKITKADLEVLRDFIEEIVLQHDETQEMLMILRVGTRKELKYCFSAAKKKTEQAPRASDDDEQEDDVEDYGEDDHDDDDDEEVGEEAEAEQRSPNDLLDRMPRIHGAGMFYHFPNSSEPWYFGLYLLDGYTWKEVKNLILKRRQEKPPTEKYGLSRESAQVFSWLIGHNYELFKRHLSPPVEDHLKVEIGIDVEKVGKKNIEQLLYLICEEITEKTEFEARIIPWASGYYDPKDRIFFRQKPYLECRALAATQDLLRYWGAEVGQDQILKTLHELCDTSTGSIRKESDAKEVPYAGEHGFAPSAQAPGSSPVVQKSGPPPLMAPPPAPYPFWLKHQKR